MPGVTARVPVRRLIPGYLVLALVLTWPLAAHLGSALPLGTEPVETVPLFNLWTLRWDQLQLGDRGCSRRRTTGSRRRCATPLPGEQHHGPAPRRGRVIHGGDPRPLTDQPDDALRPETGYTRVFGGDVADVYQVGR